MQYCKDFDINNFPFWSGAKDTMRDVFAAGKADDLQSYLEDVFDGRTPTATEINDFVWFERDAIYDFLGLDENGNLKGGDDGETDECVGECDRGCCKKDVPSVPVARRTGISLDGIDSVGGEL